MDDCQKPERDLRHWIHRGGIDTGKHTPARLGRAIIVFMFIAALLPIFFSATTPSASAAPGWWDPAWLYRDNLYIIGAHPENYQIKIMLPFFDNSIRFLENEDTGVLPYWVESYTASSTIVWVRRLENADNQIFVYSGNAGAGSASNGGNTFILFDNFDTLNNWTQQAGTWTTSGGIMTAPAAAAGYYLRDNTIISENSYKIEAKIKGTGNYYRGPLMAEANTPIAYSASLVSAFQRGGSQPNTVFGINDWGSAAYASFTITDNVWYILGLNVASGANSAFAYTTDRATFAETATFGNSSGTGNYWGWWSHASTSVAYSVDWVLVRTFIDTEPTVTVSGDFSPSIVSVTSSHALIDRKHDQPSSSALLATTITIRITDSNGKDNMTGAKIAIRDNTDIVRENVDVWASRVEIDENTWDVSYTYNPADNLPDNALENFDVWAYVTDSRFYVNEWYNNKFVVDDGKSTFSFNPTSPYVGWPENVYGTISRVAGGTAFAENVMFIDNKHGTFNLGAGNNWSNTYTENANPSDNIGVVLRWVDGVLDGTAASSYRVNENIIFNIELRYENNGVLIPEPENINGTMLGIENRNMIIKFYWDGGTYSKTMENRVENIILASGGHQPTWVQLNDNNRYWRGRVPEVNGGLLRFYLVRDNTLLTQYQFLLEDHTNMFGPPNTTEGQIRIRKYVDNNLLEINDDHWDAFLTSYTYLNRGDRYYIYVYRPGELRNWGMFQAEATTSNVLKIYSLAFGDAPLTIADLITLGASRQMDTGYVVISYQDLGENTDNIIFYVYGFADNTLLFTTYADYTSIFSTTWIGAENSKSYMIRIEATNTVFGGIFHELTIGTNLPPPSLPSAPAPPFHLPMPLATIGGLVFLFVISMSFSAIYAFLSAFATIMVAGLFVYMGWFPVSIAAVLGFLAVGVVIWKLTSGR